MVLEYSSITFPALVSRRITGRTGDGKWRRGLVAPLPLPRATVERAGQRVLEAEEQRFPKPITRACSPVPAGPGQRAHKPGAHAGFSELMTVNVGAAPKFVSDAPAATVVVVKDEPEANPKFQSEMLGKLLLIL